MKLNSKYFNNLRIKPKENKFKRKCEYGGCIKNGEFIAKTKTSHEYYYCLDHIKDFNKNFPDYFVSFTVKDSRLEDI